VLYAVIVLGVAAAGALLVSSRSDRPSGGGDDPTGWVKVERVTDGDTIVVAGGARVRLVQIDAPEVASGPECYGEQAREAARRLLPDGAEVRLARDPALDDTDQYGRVLRYVVRRDGVNVNVRLVADGAAAPYFFGGARGAHARELEDAARAARAAGRGLWGFCPGTPLSPGSGVATGPP
jgi:micrococcal nuclease